jgi:polyhydroxyalkanoate synthesis regulator phasin
MQTIIMSRLTLRLIETLHQRSLFEALKGELGEASPADIDAILADREVVNCEPELTTETIERLRAKLQATKQ